LSFFSFFSFFSFLAFFEDSSPIAEAEHGATSAADVPTEVDGDAERVFHVVILAVVWEDCGISFRASLRFCVSTGRSSQPAARGWG
jgi:hypothetical protein